MADTMIDPIPLEVAVAEGSPIGITELEVVYDGTAPPRGLFADLVEIGWSPAVASPPPRSAIDWSAPDLERGTGYTIRPYRATSRIERAAGDADASMVESAMAVARAHGAAVATEQDGDAGKASATVGPAGTVVRTMVLTSRERDVIGTLGSSVVVVDRVDTVVATTNIYRGQTCESQSPAVRLSLLVPADILDEVMGVLHRLAASTPEVHTSQG